ncbi:hypothetical protein Ae201684P_006987 [Aphanomyces euteiches]|uniref:RNI-like protein n=1 Tax=Aphanomyces euteiches TaxID=100861 RepID=A0A6G0WV08_9STRA|nr:hypothetical protein Ae201684_011416 [Aphanomyces euteiches]KAH9100793.1 hypothetical protein Ae201684P_006987 [Aphanomyces euteiches]KAH9142737.1 hypothetical protein AeRB84_013211 [Aphanomyces euteiches]
MSSPQRASYEAIAKNYSTVIVDDNVDLAWFKTYLDPRVKIELTLTNFVESIERLEDWADLCVTGISHSFSSDTWYRSQNLTAQSDLAGKDILDSIFAFAAKSTELRKLRVFLDFHAITTSNLGNIIEWFYRQPVQVLELTGGCWRAVDNAMKHRFYQTILNCTTLDKLKLDCIDLWFLKFVSFTLSARSLQLFTFDMDSEMARALSRRLQGSRVKHLTIEFYSGNSVDGLRCLLQDLDRTSIEHLEFSGLSIDVETWCELVPLIANSPLKILTLNAARFDSKFLSMFAKAIQNNHTMYELDLSTTCIANNDLQLLIQAFTHSSRQLATKRIKLLQSIHAIDTLTVHSLKLLAATCGGEFALICHPLVVVFCL